MKFQASNALTTSYLVFLSLQKDMKKKLAKKSECIGLARKARGVHQNFTKTLHANIQAVNSRKIESQRDIIRVVWDLEFMSFN